MSSSRHVAGANGGDEDGAGDDEDGEASSVAFGDRLECRLRRGFKCARVEGDVHGGVDAARADHAIVRMNDDPGPSQSSSRGAACGTRSHCRPVSEPGK
jgi:hypothetical protein